MYLYHIYIYIHIHISAWVWRRGGCACASRALSERPDRQKERVVAFGTSVFKK